MALRIELPKRFKSLHPRTIGVVKNGLWGLVIKVGSTLISLISVPITFDYLSKTAYGVWLTLSSLTTLMALLDIGVGNGLRNRFAEAVSEQNYKLARSYLSTAYVLFGVIQVGLIALFVSINNYIPWQRILNTEIDNNELRQIALITFLSISLKLVLDLINFTLLALQNTAIINALQLLTNALILLAIYILSYYSTGSLVNLAIVSAVFPLAVTIISSFVLYSTSLKIYKPSFRLAKRQYNNNLLSLGYKFFLIQIAVIVIFYTDNLIITQLFGPSEVTPYNIAYRYFNLASTVFAIILAPFWSAYTEAHIKQDYEWMRSSYRRLQQLWTGLVVLIIVMALIASNVYHLWLRDRVEVPLLLNLFMGLSVIITCWNNVAVSVINGMGKVRLQLYSALSSALVNIPLAVYLGRELQLGSAGVILATCISLLIGSVLSAIQARKLITNKASGIWAS
ncbi:lipopolysaccharide biosynthesis protein [Fibrella forsythiae]|uniref:Polysaccharide biosynthesis C-terminal domain-containing protein n=1 Tax=Fibrella forsythiae TaxID=2817061 RepID=A0ABS3JJ44_9BACT|nr:polysaccharide biosynthesis C-terminal domain-containing protein [Fibrella forsythiae]MBO0949259.1 polysaccharide biosynthesis C-terminal domain-containing protein [Fibrella forsythiae]